MKILEFVSTIVDLSALAISFTSHLYIGEGTFNRTRKSALAAVAKTLWETEENERSNGID